LDNSLEISGIFSQLAYSDFAWAKRNSRGASHEKKTVASIGDSWFVGFVFFVLNRGWWTPNQSQGR
jgi:hypothetical protein